MHEKQRAERGNIHDGAHYVDPLEFRLWAEARRSGDEHYTLRVTPARKAGVADHLWSLDEIMALLGSRAPMRVRGWFQIIGWIAFCFGMMCVPIGFIGSKRDTSLFNNVADTGAFFKTGGILIAAGLIILMFAYAKSSRGD